MRNREADVWNGAWWPCQIAACLATTLCYVKTENIASGGHGRPATPRPLLPGRAAAHRPDCGRRPGLEIIDAGQERVADELPDGRHFLRPPQGAGALGRGGAAGPAAVDSVVGRRARPLPRAVGRRVGHHRHERLGRAGQPGGRPHDGPAAGVLRSLPTFFRAQQKREFIRRPTRDLHGARIGIVGLGGNGRRLAEVLSAFRTTILATDWFPVNKPPHVAELLPADALDDILPRVDILILAAPLTEHTRGMIDARRLALLPQGAILINVARGPLVVENDLVAALESGHLGGAGVDVTELEPLPPTASCGTCPT